MTVDDLLRKILVILPDAEIDEVVDGELIISTGLCEGEDGELESVE